MLALYYILFPIADVAEVFDDIKSLLSIIKNNTGTHIQPCLSCERKGKGEMRRVYVW